MKIKARLPAIIIIITIAILTIAWIRYQKNDFITVKIPQSRLYVPVVSELTGKVISVSNNKIVIHTLVGDIDIYNYKDINNIIHITPKKYITFITQTDISYSGKQENFIIAVVAQGEKIFLNRPILYIKHSSFIANIIPKKFLSFLIKETRIL